MASNAPTPARAAATAAEDSARGSSLGRRCSAADEGSSGNFGGGEGQNATSSAEEGPIFLRGEGLSQATGQDVHGEAIGERAEHSGAGEEGRAPNVLRGPTRVSRREIEEHELTHTPYRSWCRYCVRGRARNAPHRRSEEDRNKTPRISMDYFFMSTVDEAASSNPLLVVLDESTGEKYARAVGQKGLGSEGGMDWLVKDISDELKSWGHAGGEGGHILIKTDGERSILAVRDALAQYHGGKVVPETPPRGESQSNGAIEEAGKTVREYARVLKEHVEDKAQIQLASTDVLVMWMIRWSAMLLSRYSVGKDGKTPYERRRGRKCNIPVVVFGEKVYYKELRQNKDHKDKLQSEWFTGIWLGHARSSNEHLIGTKSGAIKAYAIKRQGEDQRWDADLIQQLQGTPQQPDPNKPGLTVPIRVSFDQVPAAVQPVVVEVAQRQIRRMRIGKALLSKYGYSSNCEGCRFSRAGLGETRGHTEDCRARIEAAMACDEEGRRTLEEQRLRMSRRIAEGLEAKAGANEAAGEPTLHEPRDNPERAQNTSAGCSHRGARSGEEPSIVEEAQDIDMTAPDAPMAQGREPRALDSDVEPDGRQVDHRPGPREEDRPDASLVCGRRSRSRSPHRPEEFHIGTPERASGLAAVGKTRLALGAWRQTPAAATLRSFSVSPQRSSEISQNTLTLAQRPRRPR